MVTVIDMTTGELLYSSKPQKSEGDIFQVEEAYSLPALGLQEIELEPERNPLKMPPELAQVPLNAFLAKFD